MRLLRLRNNLQVSGAGRTDYGPTYYAAFLIDPDGNNIEAVCMR